MTVVEWSEKDRDKRKSGFVDFPTRFSMACHILKTIN